MSGNFLAIDFETANQYRDSACSIGLVRVKHGEITDQVVHLIRPPYREFLFTYIHGLSWKDVARSPNFRELWPVIAPLFEGVDFIAAHNASFDSSVLRACLRSHDLEMPAAPFMCTVQLSRSQWEIYPTKLPDVCRYLDIELKHHEALSDALACAKIVMSAEKLEIEKSLAIQKLAYEKKLRKMLKDSSDLVI